MLQNYSQTNLLCDLLLRSVLVGALLKINYEQCAGNRTIKFFFLTRYGREETRSVQYLLATRIQVNTVIIVCYIFVLMHDFCGCCRGIRSCEIVFTTETAVSETSGREADDINAKI